MVLCSYIRTNAPQAQYTGIADGLANDAEHTIGRGRGIEARPFVPCLGPDLRPNALTGLPRALVTCPNCGINPPRQTSMD